MKICSKCKNSKELIDFEPLKTSKDGLRGQCNICRGAQKALYQKNHQEQALLSSKKWQLANPGQRKSYRLANPNKISALRAKRRAAKLKRTPKWLTKEQFAEIEDFYTIVNDLSWLSEEPLHVDHIVPLQGKNVSGLHVPWNLQILPAKLNLSKSNKF